MPYDCGLSLGSWNLPDPTKIEGWNVIPTLRVVDQIMADGSVETDVISNSIKYQYKIQWRYLTKLEFDNVTGAFEQFVTSNSELVLDGMNLTAPVTVTRERGQSEISSTGEWIGGSYRYHATMLLREV